MAYFDIFNGDADGICALHQLRLAEPRPSAQLVTGVKRDIRLLTAPELAGIGGTSLTVLDISLDSNRDQLIRLLDDGNTVLYVDHHSADPIPRHPLLTTKISTSATTCTSLLVNAMLQGRFASWAVCGAFGDNLHEPARALAKDSGLTDAETEQLREVGELLNYNGYGSAVADLHFPPAELYRTVSGYEDPLAFFAEAKELATLREGLRDDVARAGEITEYPTPGPNRVFFLPDAPWARRISGDFSNKQARQRPEVAHAMITHNPDGSLRVSVRAPLSRRENADVLCKQFTGGGGRAAAAGINSLPAGELPTFLKAFDTIYP